jgi:hypothetical protein
MYEKIQFKDPTGLSIKDQKSEELELAQELG